jgi:hypothetical protein
MHRNDLLFNLSIYNRKHENEKDCSILWFGGGGEELMHCIFMKRLLQLT